MKCLEKDPVIEPNMLALSAQTPKAHQECPTSPKGHLADISVGKKITLDSFCTAPLQASLEALLPSADIKPSPGDDSLKRSWRPLSLRSVQSNVQQSLDCGTGEKTKSIPITNPPGILCGSLLCFWLCYDWKTSKWWSSSILKDCCFWIIQCWKWHVQNKSSNELPSRK